MCSRNDPVSFVDPSGYFAIHIIACGVIGGITGGFSAYMAGADGMQIAQASLIGASAGALSATGFGGILLSGSIGGVSNVGIQLSSGTELSNINKTSALISGAASMFGTGVGSIASKFLMNSKILYGGANLLSNSLELSNKYVSAVSGGLIDYGGQNLMQYSSSGTTQSESSSRAYNENNYSMGNFNFK